MFNRNKKHVHSPRAQKRRKIFFILKTSLFVFLLIGLFYVFFYIANSKFINISSIQVTGANAVSVENLKTTVFDLMDDKYLFFIPKTNIFLFPEEEIIDRLGEVFPRIAEALVQRKSLTSIEIKIVERNSAYIWCSTASPDDCYFLDEFGVIFYKAPIFSDNPYFVFHGPVFDNPIGAQIIDKDSLVFISSFVSGIADLEMPFGLADSVSVSGPDDYVLNFKDSDFQILFDTDESVDYLLGNIALALSESDIRDKIETLKYIDVRFGNKLFFK